MPLNKIQSRFKDLMLDHPDALNAPGADFATRFQSGTIPLSERLKVYRNNIVGSLTDVMIASFPILEKLVGKEFLEGCARSFILKNPPQTGCLNMYGHGFDGFLANFEPAKTLPYLPDVARLEIALNEAYYAPDDDPLTAGDLAKIPPDSLADTVLPLRASACLIASRYPLTAIRDYCLAEAQDKTLNLDQGDEMLMIYRPQHESRIVKLDKAEFAILTTLQKNIPLGEALEQITNNYESFDFQAFLQKHLALETFTAIEANSSS